MEQSQPGCQVWKRPNCPVPRTDGRRRDNCVRFSKRSRFLRFPGRGAVCEENRRSFRLQSERRPKRTGSHLDRGREERQRLRSQRCRWENLQVAFSQIQVEAGGLLTYLLYLRRLPLTQQICLIFNFFISALQTRKQIAPSPCPTRTCWPWWPGKWTLRQWVCKPYCILEDVSP